MNHVAPEATWPTAILTSACTNEFDPQTLAMATCVGDFEPEPVEASRTFTVTGVLSDKARWRDLETQWNRALRDETLRAFSARDFASCGSGRPTMSVPSSMR